MVKLLAQHCTPTCLVRPGGPFEAIASNIARIYNTSRVVSGNPDILGCAFHFERMLYDNSQLACVYLHAWQVTGSEFFRTITEEILDYVIREMLDPQGGSYSTQDADSEGEEGKFFV